MRGLQTSQLSCCFLAMVFLCITNANLHAHGRYVENNKASRPSYWGAYFVKSQNGRPIRKLWVFRDRLAETYPEESVKSALASETQLFTTPIPGAGGLGVFGIPIAFPDAGVTTVTTERFSCLFHRDGSTSRGSCRDKRNRMFNFQIVADRLTRFELPCSGAVEKTCTYYFADGQPITRLFLQGLLRTKN